MSKVTNPVLEASVTCGFYNSDMSGTRKYDASQMSQIFDGIIKDGIFGSIGSRLIVQASSGNTVNVGTGKAWFNHTWTQNDAVLPITCDPSHSVMSRIDAIVIEVNENDKDNYIKFIPGEARSNPSRPTLSNSNGVYQYALCYITRSAGSTEIKQSDITNMVGVDTPFITGVLQTASLNDLTRQWESELDDVINDFIRVQDIFMDSQQEAYDDWFKEMRTLINQAIEEVGVWTEAQKNTILDWFENIKNQLSSDPAANLQIQIDKAEIERILMVGLTDGMKKFSEDGLTITSTDSSGKTLVKTFSSDFSTCTSVLTDSYGSELGRLVKTFASDGSTVDSVVTII